MKRIILRLILTTILISAFYSCTTNTKFNIKKQFDDTDTIGYYNARLLKGLGMFYINKSTFKDIYKQLITEIKNDSRYPKYLYPKLVIDVCTYDTIPKLISTNYLDKKQFGCPRIKKIKLNKYFIGDIEISNLELTFFDNILIEIYCNHNDKIEEGFIYKYGKDNYFKNNIWVVNGKKTTNRPSDDKLRDSKLIVIDERYYWHNNLLLVESVTYNKYKYKDQRAYYGSYFKIITKDSLMKKQILDCSNAAYKAKERLTDKSKMSDIDKL